MIDIPLRPIPRSDWQVDYDRLMRDPYLAKKYNRQTRLREHFAFIQANAGELLTRPPGDTGTIVDVGSGPGEALEIFHSVGWNTLGIEASTGEGGMGDGYLQLSKLLHERQKIEVNYTGGPAFFHTLHNEQIFRDLVLVLFRGSWAQCWAKHVGGPPHHINHDCTQQYWIWSDELFADWSRAFRAMFAHLRPGGHVLIAANRLGEQSNQQRYDKEITSVAKAAGFESIATEDSYIHKWRRPE